MSLGIFATHMLAFGIYDWREVSYVLYLETFASCMFSLFVGHSKATVANSNIGKSNASQILAANAIARRLHLHNAKSHLHSKPFSVA